MASPSSVIEQLGRGTLRPHQVASILYSSISRNGFPFHHPARGVVVDQDFSP